MTAPEPPGDRATAGGDGLVVTSAPSSVALVRRYAVDACRSLGWAKFADTVALLVSEVATNAVVHGYGSEIRVRVLDRGLRLRVEVSDGSRDLPAPRDAPARAENGRGLTFVENLAAGWGTDTSPQGKTVWFEVGS